MCIRDRPHRRRKQRRRNRRSPHCVREETEMTQRDETHGSRSVPRNMADGAGPHIRGIFPRGSTHPSLNPQPNSQKTDLTHSGSPQPSDQTHGNFSFPRCWYPPEQQVRAYSAKLGQTAKLIHWRSCLLPRRSGRLKKSLRGWQIGDVPPCLN